MKQCLEIAGISLQVIAGFIFIFSEAFKRQANLIGNLLRRWLGILGGEPRGNWKSSLVIAASILPLWIAITLIIYSFYGEGETVGLSGIGGAAFFLLMASAIYIYFVRLSRKLLLKCKLLEPRISTDESFQILLSQVVLLALSGIFLSPFVHVANVYSDSSQNSIQQAGMLLYTLVVFIGAFPIFLISFSYLGVLILRRCFNLLKDMPSWAFLSLVLALWTIGGAFLIAKACWS